ncbi:DUF7192 family protein [Streptomyces litchfieldiae]|uniref:DUF7192 domain-containing protein n=1 Tax=Streptomyces litchfieldiae TaxID=3075543 RepID=A0ABU2MLG9_9ACTN|nr:hypothetical protein [Streptomyces sp. DSM 44938]MDT0342330.1 hypothetical protein [Streptomyces sp. DSM 44938]
MSGPPPTAHRLPPLWSWREFVDRARAPDSIPDGDGRHKSAAWAGAGWEEALQLATDGWAQVVPEADVSVAALRDLARDEVLTTALVPAWDVTGSEVDIGAYLAGEPECMVDAVPQRLSSRGRVVTFLVPAGYIHTTPHASVVNRGMALTALCSAIIAAGHSVEIWSGFCAHLGKKRCAAVAKVISAAEPLDVGRLLFAMAHPAMLRRLWFAVWDSAPTPLARMMKDRDYAHEPYTCYPEDLPDGVGDPYVLPFLSPADAQWATFDSAMAWCQGVFAELGLIRDR